MTTLSFAAGALRFAARGVAAVARWLGIWGAAALAGALLGAWLALFPPSRASLLAWYAQARDAVVASADYHLRSVEIRGVRHSDETAIAAALEIEGKRTSALSFDAHAARARIEALPWVERAEVGLRTPHTVTVRIDERRPAALWRLRDRLTLVDAAGRRLEEIGRNGDRRRRFGALPLVLGDGADAAIEEALILFERAEAAGLSVAGLSRVGRRRWDLELINGPRVLLPEHEAAAALDRLASWVADADLLRRAVEQIDLRSPHQPSARMAASAR